MLTIGVYLEDVDESMGPMGVIPGAHEGELFDLYDGNDCWAGAIGDEDPRAGAGGEGGLPAGPGRAR